MIAPPATDDDLPRLWADLAIPGAVDVHVHFLPDRMQAKVWAWFDQIVGADGTPGWPIHYRTSTADRLAVLRRIGLRAWTALVYPHKPGMAAWLNDWALAFAAAEPEVVPGATFYPEPDAAAYVERALAAGARVFKCHVPVGAYDPADRHLRPVWRQLASAGVPVVIHIGSLPMPAAHQGPPPLARLLEAVPDLVVVVAHLGMAEYEGFLDLAARHPGVHLDTAVALTDFADGFAPFPPELVPRLGELRDRIVLGSDFPSIPHPYAEQISALMALDLGEDWLRAVLHDNGARLLGLEAGAT